MAAIAQAAEFRDIRLKSGEKSLYKHINKDISIKFPVQVDIALSAHKVSLILQAELGGMDFPVGEQFAKLKSQFQQDKAMVFQHVNRLVRCVIDCQLTRGDSVSARHALELARCFASRVWDNSPLQLKQLEQIGNVAVRKLANAGINSIESLENTEAHRIETVIGRGPPFGMKLLSQLAQFPKLRVLVKMAGKEMKPQRCIKIRLKAEIGFLNENVPVCFRRKPIFACFLAETSDGQLIDFRRIAASKLRNGHEVLLTAELTKPSQHIMCHIMCDEIAGTCRSAEMRPGIPVSLFPTCTEQKEGEKDEISSKHLSSRQSQIVGVKRKESEDFDESGLDDRDLLAAENVEIVDIDAFDDEVASLPARKDQSKNRNPGNSKRQRTDDDIGESIQMGNGKWACNHKCKDKAKCKHVCCKEGLDKPPKPPKKSSSSTANDHHPIESMLDAVNNDSTGPVASKPVNNQTELKKSPVGRRGQNRRNSAPGAKEAESLAQLHNATTPFMPSRALKSTSWNLHSKKAQATPSSAADRAIPRKFANQAFLDEDPFETDWVNEVGLEDLEELTNSEDLLSRRRGASGTAEAVQEAGLDDALLDLGDDDFDFDDNDASMLEAGMVGLDDSMQLKKDADSRQIEKDDSHSNTSFSSRTVRSLSPTRAERSQVDDLFDGDDGTYDFDQEDFDEADPVQHRLSNPGADEGVPDPSNNDGPETSTSRKLFFTSPERPGLASTNPSVDGVTSSPRRNPNSSDLAIDVRASLKKIPNNPAAGSVSATPKREAEREVNVDETAAAREIKQLEEEEKLLKKHGINRSFYDEFKDFVEFI
jgi:Sec63 Brl domain